MIHVVPAAAGARLFVRVSPLADAAGWVDVDPGSLRHRRFPEVYALGDACNAPTPNRRRRARKQAPVVAPISSSRWATFAAPRSPTTATARAHLRSSEVRSCSREFGYGGKLMPSFPAWLIDGTKAEPPRMAPKERMLPPIYWKAMLKGREWLAKPEKAAA